MGDVRKFLSVWCNKKNLKYSYDAFLTESVGKKRTCFESVLKVEGFDFVPKGFGKKKKTANDDAIKNFFQHYVKLGQIDPNEVPVQILRSSASTTNILNPSPNTKEEEASQVKLEEETFTLDWEEITENESTENATYEECGNWTLKVARTKLKYFMDLNKLTQEYALSESQEQEECESVEMVIPLKHLNMAIKGIGTAPDRDNAIKCCALACLAQLHRLGIIESYQGHLKSSESERLPKEGDRGKAQLAPELEKQLFEYLENMDIKLPELPKGENSIPLLTGSVAEEMQTDETPEEGSGVVPWSPPSATWDPWNGCKVDDSFLHRTLDQISSTLLKFHEDKVNIPDYLKMNEERLNLPIADIKSQILEAVERNPVVIINGKVGCGKSTQVCQYILDHYIESGRGANCNVVVTQTKKISVWSSSEKVAKERCESVGDSCGYSERFSSVLPRSHGGILFCTPDVLLRHMENGLQGVSHVIVNKIGEYDATTDFLLAVLRDMAMEYHDLRIILLLTRNSEEVSYYFDSCPVLDVPDNLHPVTELFLEDVVETLNYIPDTLYKVKGKQKREKRRQMLQELRKLDDDDDDDEEEDEQEYKFENADDEEEVNLNKEVSEEYSSQTRKVMAAMQEKRLETKLLEKLIAHFKKQGIPGSVAIFLPGWTALPVYYRILKMNTLLGSDDFNIIIVHEDLSKEELRLIYEPAPAGVTKLYLTTSIAESSLILTDVVCVIDCCKTKTKEFVSYQDIGMDMTIWTSKENAEQRKDCAGLTRPGICYRMCSRARFERLPEKLSRFLMHIPLHELALLIKLLKLGDIESFFKKTIVQPSKQAMEMAVEFLKDQKFLNSIQELTSLGRIIGRLPIDPKLGKMLYMACTFKCGDPMSTIIADHCIPGGVFNMQYQHVTLTKKQREFAGTVFSDQLVTVKAAMELEKLQQDEDVTLEMSFWQENELVLCKPSLQTFCEAKGRLRKIMISSGVPEECFASHDFNYEDGDKHLDMVIALMCMGLYPNVCCHVRKRIFQLGNKRSGTMYRDSVLWSSFNPMFPFRYFIFKDLVFSKGLYMKNMTMVSPIHLLLFGSNQIDLRRNLVSIDDWIQIEIRPKISQAIVALRPLLEDFMMRTVKNPSTLTQLNSVDKMLVNVTQELCRMYSSTGGVKPAGLFGFRPFNVGGRGDFRRNLHRVPKHSKRKGRGNDFEGGKNKRGKWGNPSQRQRRRMRDRSTVVNWNQNSNASVSGDAKLRLAGAVTALASVSRGLAGSQFGGQQSDSGERSVIFGQASSSQGNHDEQQPSNFEHRSIVMGKRRNTQKRKFDEEYNDFSTDQYNMAPKRPAMHGGQDNYSGWQASYSSQGMGYSGEQGGYDSQNSMQMQQRSVGWQQHDSLGQTGMHRNQNYYSGGQQGYSSGQMGYTEAGYGGQNYPRGRGYNRGGWQNSYGRGQGDYYRGNQRGNRNAW